MNITQSFVIKLRSIYGKSCGRFTNFIPNGLNIENNRDNIQELICNALLANKPLMVARLGRTEIDVCENVMYTFYKKRSNWKFICWKGQPNFLNPFLIPNINKLSGFWPWNDVNALKRFYHLMVEDMREVDILGSWCPNEVYFEEYLNHSIKVDRERMTPLLTKTPWTRALKGKKVLVVHPFAETIKSQYTRRRVIFPNDPDILPDFKLQVLPALQTLGSEDPRFADWFEALDYMKKQIDSIDYDVCLLGCGAYGFPLAAHCKRMGKQAVHLGGVLQLLFGIVGNRWETDPGYQTVHPYLPTYKNDYWIRPQKNETPTTSKNVENACYW